MAQTTATNQANSVIVALPANSKYYDTIICFSHLRWDFVFQRPQHLMTRLSKDTPVIYVEEATSADGEAAAMDMRRCASSDVMVATPRLPIGLDENARGAALASLIDGIIKDRGIAAPALWYYTPMALPFSRHLRAAAIVYDCMDELANFRFAPPELGTLEAELFASADVVFTGGHSLYEAKRHLHGDIHPFPSSVDQAHFRLARTGLAQPEDLQAAPAPRLGYYGVIDERLDLALLDAVAEARPDWSLIMVGPVAKLAPEDLPRRANIHYLGMKDYAALPGYLASWDAALMPFAINESTRFISPTKTPEYLAGGLPVVTTPIRDVVRHYGALEAVHVAGSSEDFIHACERALALGTGASTAWRDEADAALSDLSWDSTQLRMAAHIDRVARARTARAASKHSAETLGEAPPSLASPNAEEASDVVSRRRSAFNSRPRVLDPSTIVPCLSAGVRRDSDHGALLGVADAIAGPTGGDGLAVIRRGSAMLADPTPLAAVRASREIMRRSGQPDVLVVGAGFAGAVMAERLAADGGKRVLVVDRRPHIGGNAYDRPDAAGLLIHQYGPHIFHTNSEQVFAYLSRFTHWRPYEHRVLAQVRGGLVPIPINRTTINRLYGLDLQTEADAAAFLQSRAEPVDTVRTSEDVVVSTVGRELYELFFRGYTRKQWGLDPSELDKSVTARVPTRTNDDDRYFTDSFQAMPLHGYTRMFQKMLDHENIEVMTGVDYRDVAASISCEKLIYTGPIDEFFDHRFGALPYRSLRFKHETHDREWFQTVGTVNHPEEATPYTRVSEFKHLTGQIHPKTSVTYEYPSAEGDPYYPIPRPENQALFKKYEALAAKRTDVTFVGRLATYRYYNMDQVVGQALAAYRRLSWPRTTVAAPVQGATAAPD